MSVPDLDILSTLFDLAPAGIAVADEQGRYLHVNTTYCRMFGYEAHELIGRTFALILPEDSRDMVPAILEMALSNDRSAPTHWRACHRDGSLRTVHSTFQTLQRANGERRILTILTDVTPLVQTVSQLKESQQDLLRLNESLEQQVAERTLALQHLAREDALTGVANRRAFEEDAQGAMALAQRYGRPLSLILLDLDHFKAINDQRGHRAGDEVLRETAVRIRSLLRGVDKFARWGGEEFIVLLPETSLDEAVQAGLKLLTAVQRTPIPLAGGALTVTFSAGVVSWLPGESLSAWVHRADEHLYRAKQAGRSQLSWPGQGVGEDACQAAPRIAPQT